MNKTPKTIDLRPIMSFGHASFDVQAKHGTGVTGVRMQCPVCGTTRVWLDTDSNVLVARDKETLLVPFTEEPSFVDEAYDEKETLLSVATPFICENEHEFSITFMSGRPTTKDRFPVKMHVDPEPKLFYEIFPDCLDDNEEVPL